MVDNKSGDECDQANSLERPITEIPEDGRSRNGYRRPYGYTDVRVSKTVHVSPNADNSFHPTITQGEIEKREKRPGCAAGVPVNQGAALDISPRPSHYESKGSQRDTSEDEARTYGSRHRLEHRCKGADLSEHHLRMLTGANSRVARRMRRN
ncbi:MAG TPA: hypothetical protein VNL97_01610 [Solirubrobacterales bacterium]|nr:hypothetical protein [Solirubrobacterales bacterium]